MLDITIPAYLLVQQYLTVEYGPVIELSSGNGFRSNPETELFISILTSKRRYRDKRIVNNSLPGKITFRVSDRMSVDEHRIDVNFEKIVSINAHFKRRILHELYKHMLLVGGNYKEASERWLDFHELDDEAVTWVAIEQGFYRYKREMKAKGLIL